jgi:molybdopterin-guanine dinucleotide biosynthesis protein A
LLKATAVILAGGKSTRMGSDKAFLAVGRQCMIERVACLLKTVFAEVLIAGGSAEAEAQTGLQVVGDRIPGSGPLGGIHAGLTAAVNPLSLVVACDMPFISPDLAGLLVERAEGYDVAVPRHGEYMEPLFAVYRKTCIPAIEESLLSSRYKVVDFYSRVRVKYVNETDWRPLAGPGEVFFNVNTPQDLKEARKWLKKT